jgi:hypothetical protein
LLLLLYESPYCSPSFKIKIDVDEGLKNPNSYVLYKSLES